MPTNGTTSKKCISRNKQYLNAELGKNDKLSRLITRSAIESVTKKS